jgi:hypothetical protein
MLQRNQTKGYAIRTVRALLLEAVVYKLTVAETGKATVNAVYYPVMPRETEYQ